MIIKKVLIYIIVIFLIFIISGYFVNYRNKSNLVCDDCNLIIISLTNLKKDSLGLYGYERDTTPQIDNFFKESLIFENAFAPTPWTLPNAASLFTSLYSKQHEVINRYESKKIPDNVKTFSEILKEKQYLTAAFTGGGDYSSFYGFDRGFNTYNDQNIFGSITDNVDDINDWLEENKKEKFFLFIQGFDIHCPFDSPFNNKYESGNQDLNNPVCYWNLEKNKSRIVNNQKEYLVYKQDEADNQPKLISLDEEDKERLVSLYDGAISYADQSIGEIFLTIEKLKLEKKTIIIFLSEHGDLIGDNDRFMRTDILGTFRDEVLNIPLLIKHPYINQKTKINGLVNLVDLMPTLLSFLDIEYDLDEMQGYDLKNLIKNNEIVNEYVFGEMTYNGSNENPFFKDIYEISMVRDLEYKLIYEKTLNLSNKSLENEKHMLYKINEDSNESVNLINKNKIEFNRLKDELNQF